MHNIFIATSTFAVHSNEPIIKLEDGGEAIALNSSFRKVTSEELIKYAYDSTGIIAGTELYTKEVLEQLPNLKVISRLGVGMDNIDLEFTKEKGIKVFKTKTTPAPAVAELVLGLMLDLARKISYQNNILKSGTWKKEMGNLLYGKTLGIIGLGTIGKTLVKLVKGFDFKIMAFDMFHDDKFAKEHEVNYCDIGTLLTQSDIVSIHLNLTSETNTLMNKERIAALKPGCIFINTSRGEIINEDALYVALKEKHIFGAGLDVFREEPYSGPLLELNNVILTPHIGSYAKEIRIKMEIEAAENLIRGLNEE
jgi:D-3-phosphoglycerate dehydrogenase|tara:strand:+ start:32 stop:958 length:927 start_codon:yes stop_codon:yes gene_type:complete